MRFASIAPVLAALALTVPAAAEQVTTSVGVAYDDLDLATEAGQKELDARLEKAAKSVCGLDEARTGTRLASADARRCYRDARGKLDQQFASVIRRQAAGG